MLRKLFHTIVASSIAVTPLSASAADQYFFRYKTPFTVQIPPVTDEEYGIGNDIVAYYVTPTGRPFLKKIPVATKDVVTWVKDSGTIPAGISLDVSAGVLSGTAALPDTQTVLFHGYDAQDHKIARAEVHFTVFEPVGSESIVDFYGHTGSYFFGVIPSPDGVDVYSWEVVGDQPLPAGMTMTGSGFEGTPENAGTYDIMLRGFDFLGREVAFATGTFLVEDGPKVEEVVPGVASFSKSAASAITREEFADQVVDKGLQQTFSITPTVKNSLGTVTYRLIPATVRPSGIAFASSTGALSGVFDDFDTSAYFQIQARDSYDGTTGTSNSFKLTTLPAYLDLSAMPNLSGYVNTAYYGKLTSANVVAGATWSIVQGTLPDGIQLNSATGEFTGTPTKTETQSDIIVAVSGVGMVPEQSSPFTFKIFSEKIAGTATAVAVRTNEAFTTDPITITKGGSEGFSFVAPKSLPAEVNLDPVTGAISSTTGIPVAGNYDQIIDVATPPGNTGKIGQELRVYNGLDIDYGDQTVVRRKHLNVFPTIGDNSIIGSVRYKLNTVGGASIPNWLRFNGLNGNLYGWPTAKSTAGVVYGPYTVTVTDALSSDTSDPFTITVKERDQPEIKVDNKGAERFVYNWYNLLKPEKTVGDLSFTWVQTPANWPSTLRIAEGSGYLVGSTKDPVGTVYQGLQFKVKDAEEFEALSDVFDLTVIEPKGLSGLTGTLNKTFEWTANQPFSMNLPTLSNGYGELAYAFGTALSGVAVTDVKTGKVDGTVAAEGTYTLPFQIDDETDRDPAKGTLTLKINPALEVLAEASYKTNRAADFSLQAPNATGGTAPLVYTLTVGTLPKGVTFSNGQFSGIPSEEGTFPLTVSVTDKAGVSKPASFSLVVDKPLPIELSYKDTTVVTGQYSYVVPTLKNAVGGISKATWTVSGTLPPGMSFTTKGVNGGRFTGTPKSVGIYKDITVTVTDEENRSEIVTINISVSLNGAAQFDDVTLTHRKGSTFSDTLSASNVNAPLTFTSADLTALGLVLNGTTGSVTGSFADAGTYTAAVSVKDGTNKQASATVTFTIVGDLSATASDVATKRYTTTSGAPPVVLDSIGPLTYSLASGTLPAGLSIDPNTGSVVGATDDTGTFPNIVVSVTDSDGVSTSTNSFTVTVGERDPLELTAPDTYEFSQYVAGTVPVTTANGVGKVTYTISPALPNGLSLGSDGQISGTSDVKVAAASYVLTAVDSKGGQLGTATKTISISVRERDPLDIVGETAVEFVQYADAQALFPTVSAIGAVSYSISPDLPAGLAFNTTTGTISGTSDEEVAAASYLITAVDSKGGTLGTAKKSISLKVKAREPLTVSGADSFKFVQHADGKLSFGTTNAIGAVAYTISPDLPAGLVLNTTDGSISGTATIKQDATDYVLTAVDEKGGALGTTTKTVAISVGDRLPLTITTAAAQSVLLDHPLFLSLSADNVVGAAGVTWTKVAGTEPAGVTFDPTTGSFSGTPTEFGTAASITIRATDDYEGLDERTFVFTVLQDGTPIIPSAVGGTTRVGQPFDIPAATAANVVGNPTWSINAGSTGVFINSKTGKISGTPATTFTSDVTLNVSDATGRSEPVTIQLVSAPLISVSAPSTVDLVFNYDPATTSVATATNTVGAVNWTISGTLPKGISINPATGALTGKPLELGTFGPIYVTAADTLPGSTKSSAFTIKVTMNADPLELNVTDFVTKVGYPVQTVTPTYGNNLGPVSFFSTDLGSTGLTVNPLTGVLTGTALATTDVFVNVSVKDRDTTRVTSKPVHYQVLPNMVVSVPSQVIVSALADMTPVTPSRMYVIGSSTWDELDQSVHKLPDGMTWDSATGTLKGNPQEIGTFGPFTVSSVDSLGDRGVSNQFTIKSNPGAIFIGLAAATLPDATKRTTAYSYDFKNNLTYVGMDESELTWALGAGSPPGLSIANGVLSGTPSLSGTYTFQVSASYGGATAKRTYTLVVKLPDIDLQLATGTLPDAKRALTGKDNSYAFDFKSVTTRKNIPADKVVYKIEPFALNESFPDGLAVTGGVVSGTATSKKGDYSFRVTATFTDNTDENISVTSAYVLKVTDEIAFAFNSAGLSAPTKRLAYSFDFGTLIDDTTIKGVTKSQLVWSWSVDPNRNPATTMATVPTGLSISGSTVSGTPVNSGTYALILQASYDGRIITKTVSLVIGLQTTSLVMPATLADGMRTEAYSANLQTLSTATGYPAASTAWTVTVPATVGTGEIAGLPIGLTLSAAGLLSGTPTTAGKFTFQVNGKWSDTNATAETISESKLYTVTIAAKTGNYKQVMAGGYATCGLTSDNGVKCWGAKAYTGYAAAANSAVPTFVTGLSSGVKSLGSTGGTANHLCVVTDAGAAKCWGDGDNGKLGNNGTADALTPVTPTGLGSGVASVATGTQNGCAVMTDGTLKCWGYNSNGQLGNGSTTTSNVPVTIAGATDVKKVVIGNSHICYLTNGGTVMCSGNNFQAEFGNGNRTSTTAFVASGGGVNGGAGITGVKDITASTYATCFVLNSGVTKCAGYDQYGEIGTGTVTSSIFTAPQTAIVSSASIASAATHICAVTSSSGAKCWGQGTSGRLGTNSVANSGAPTDVVGLTAGVLQVVAGAQHSCALMQSGGVKCWGNNNNAQVGAVGISTSNIPVDVSE
jgi:alpha-tubulin suppressor-like RCC1 family protein